MGHTPYTGRSGEAYAYIPTREVATGHVAQMSYNTGNGTFGLQHGETPVERVEVNSSTVSSPACLSCSSETSLGQSSARDYLSVCTASSASESVVGNNNFTIRGGQQFLGRTDEVAEATLKHGFESNGFGTRCATDNIITLSSSKRTRLDSEGITYLDEANFVKKTRRTAGDGKEIQDNKPASLDPRTTGSVFPELESGDWHALAPDVGDCCGEGSERCEDDAGGQGDEDSNLQWHEGFTLPLGKDGRGELIKRMRSVHKADREFCRFSLEGMGIDFKRLAHATVEELWKIAYRWGLFGYAVKLSKKYGKTTTSQSRKKTLQNSPGPNFQEVSPACERSR